MYATSISGINVRKEKKEDAFFTKLFQPPKFVNKTDGISSSMQPSSSPSEGLGFSQIFHQPKNATSPKSLRVSGSNSWSTGQLFTDSNEQQNFKTSTSQFGSYRDKSSHSFSVPAAPSISDDLLLTQAFENTQFAKGKEFRADLSFNGDRMPQNSSTTMASVLGSLDSSQRFPSQNFSANKLNDQNTSIFRPSVSTKSTFPITSLSGSSSSKPVPSVSFEASFPQPFVSSWSDSAAPRVSSAGPKSFHESSGISIRGPVRDSFRFSNHDKLRKSPNSCRSNADKGSTVFRTPFLRKETESLDLDNILESNYSKPETQSDQHRTMEDFASRNFCTTTDNDDLTVQNKDMHKLHPVTEIPDLYRNIFPFGFFNAVQSKVFDDVFYTDKPLVVGAPTGSGKTVIFELAIVRLMLQQQEIDRSASSSFKVVYMAPVKALCSERYADWNTKFGPLGLKCLELTGDTEIEDYYELQEVNIILTTPEKWDIMTRRWRDNKSLVQLTRLFFIDEVHTLNDDIRGATLEAVVSRMKTVQLAISRTHSASSGSADCELSSINIRFIAVSATIPNIEDIAEWLSSKYTEAVYHSLDDTYRPVKLRKVVLSFPCSNKTSDFRFDMSLDYKLAGIIQTYSELKPTLVFCSTRKGVTQAAATLVKEAKFIFNSQQKQKLQKLANSFKDQKLADVVCFGVGYHHAGMEVQDRKIIETIFAQGDLAVLFSTTTLAIGVNLPAHLVVIKSTQHYVAGVYQECTETQILQMIGRAGRPQFDTSATAVIMTRSGTKAKYESLLNGTQVIESSLHLHLVEHLNAEIVLDTISDVSVALEWIRSTFLYIRINKNPTHYGIPVGLTKDRVEQKLQELCLKNLNALANIQLVEMDEDGFILKSSNTGRLMARYCVAFETMKIFHGVSGKVSLDNLLTVLCSSSEFKEIQLRMNEKKLLNSLNQNKNAPTIRFPMQGKMKNASMKVNCLIQAQLGCLPLQDFALQQDTTKIIKISQRISKCLVEVLWNHPDFTTLQSAVVLCKCFSSKLWEDTKFVSRQLPGIGIALASALVNAGMTSFESIAATNPRDLEMIVNRQPPFGNHILEAVSNLPKYEISLEQTSQRMANIADVVVSISLENLEELRNRNITMDRVHTTVLLIGDSDNKVVYKLKISDAQIFASGPWTRKFQVKRATSGDELNVNLVNQQWVGLDSRVTFVPQYSTAMRASKNKNEKEEVIRKTKSEVPSQKNSNVKTKDAVTVQAKQQCSSSGSGKKAPAIKTGTIEACLDNCKAIANARDKAFKGSAPVENCFRELKHRLEGFDNTPAVKRLKAGVPATPSLKDFAYKPSQPKISPHPSKLDPSHQTPRGWEVLDLFQKRNKATLDCYAPEDFQSFSLDNDDKIGCIQNNGTDDNFSFDTFPNLEDEEENWDSPQGMHQQNRASDREYLEESMIVGKYNLDDFSDFEEDIGNDKEILLKGCQGDVNYSKPSLFISHPGIVNKSKEYAHSGVFSREISSSARNSAPFQSRSFSTCNSHSISSDVFLDQDRSNFDLLSGFLLDDDEIDDEILSIPVDEFRTVSVPDDKLKDCEEMNIMPSSFFSSGVSSSALDEDQSFATDIFHGIF